MHAFDEEVKTQKMSKKNEQALVNSLDDAALQVLKKKILKYLTLGANMSRTCSTRM